MLIFFFSYKKGRYSGLLQSVRNDAYHLDRTYCWICNFFNFKHSDFHKKIIWSSSSLQTLQNERNTWSDLVERKFPAWFWVREVNLSGKKNFDLIRFQILGPGNRSKESERFIWIRVEAVNLQESELYHKKIWH